MDNLEQKGQESQVPVSNSIKEIEKFLDDTREGVLAVDNEGIILYVNDSIKKFFQQDEVVVGKKYHEIINPSEEAIRSLEDAHMQTLKILAATRASEQDKDQKLKSTQKNLIDLMMTFVKLIESYDPYIQGHSARVARYSMMIAKNIGLPADQVQTFAYAGLFHDLGMMLVPTEILHKATSLTIKEFIMVKKHPADSVKFLRNIELFNNIIPFVLHHHERWDGDGYPMKLKEKSIPLGAQILSMAEAFDAIMSKRPYRRAKTKEEAVEIIKANKGTQFSPRVVDSLLLLISNRII